MEGLRIEKETLQTALAEAVIRQQINEGRLYDLINNSI